MKLVVDANILFSALIKDSLTRKIITDDRFELFAPTFLLLELAKYSSEIEKKSKTSKENLFFVSTRILKKIKFISDEELKTFIELSVSLTKDKKDALYIACAFYVNAEIWSNDAHLVNTKIKTWKTSQLIEFLSAQKE